MPIILFFVDGLGIGVRGPSNPFDGMEDAAPLAVFRDEETILPHDGILIRTDANLGIEGRPQSASGQTTILTGVNAPARLGYHKQGFPNQAMRDIISEHSIFVQLEREGIGPNTFANAYTNLFFDRRPRWVSATTAAVEAAGMSFRNLDDLKENRAVFQDYTNEMLIERGEVVEPRRPEEAAEVLAKLAANHQFTLYEYFITDKVGHAQDAERARAVISGLALYVRTLLELIDHEKTTLVLTSDHGNIEDLSTRNHTLNQVPTLVWGPGRSTFAARIKNLADITPTIVDVLKKKASSN